MQMLMIMTPSYEAAAHPIIPAAEDLTWKFMMASEILMLSGSTTITMLKEPSSLSATLSMARAKFSHSASNSCW